ncbi:MAG: hypothetical protein NTZ13_02925 [Candidatus Parcubacteria bacterium]|nr:hypothetical protein [Candidatus Parcubacteria bacterium]
MQTTEQKKISQKPDPFLNLSLEAKAVYVFDVSTGEVLFVKNENEQLPLASVTKVMTALVASSFPETMDIRITDGDMASGAGGLRCGEEWSLKNLLNYTLVVSSNSGASAIAGAAGAVMTNEEGNPEARNEQAFVSEMNATAKKLGMLQTVYYNPNGLDITDRLSGGYGSAKDMSTLFSYIITTKPMLLEATSYDSLIYTSLDGARHPAKNTNTVIRSIPGMVASKTGYTDLANGNLVIAFNAGLMKPVVVAVLGSSQEGRFADIEKLVIASLVKIGQGE